MSESQSKAEQPAKLLKQVWTSHTALNGSAAARSISHRRILQHEQEFSAGFLPVLVHTLLTRAVDIPGTDVLGGEAVRLHEPAGLAERFRDSLERGIDSTRPVVRLSLTTRGAASAIFLNRLAAIHVGGELF